MIDVCSGMEEVKRLTWLAMTNCDMTSLTEICVGQGVQGAKTHTSLCNYKLD